MYAVRSFTCFLQLDEWIQELHLKLAKHNQTLANKLDSLQVSSK